MYAYTEALTQRRKEHHDVSVKPWRLPLFSFGLSGFGRPPPPIRQPITISKMASENKGQDGLGNDNEEEVGEATASNPERGEALDADVAGKDAVAIQGDQLSVDLEIAMRESAAEATAQEGAHIQEALLRSKIDSALQQVVVALRLTKRNSDVLDAMLKNENLQKVRAQVEEAGCEVLPDCHGSPIQMPKIISPQQNGVRFLNKYTIYFRVPGNTISKMLCK